MTRTMLFNIPYEVTPASRPRVTKYGVFYGKNYTAFRKVVFEWLTSISPTSCYNGPLKVETIFYLKMPVSWSKKKKSLADEKYALSKRYDLDNMEKAVYDILQGTLFGDDSQIVSSTSKKIWSEEGSITMLITELDVEEAY